MQTSAAIRRNHQAVCSQMKYIYTLRLSSCAPEFMYPKEIPLAHNETFLRLFPALLFVIVRWGSAPWKVDRKNVVDTYYRAP